MAVSTIFAVSSGAGPAGVSVIRVSGPRAGTVLDEISNRPRPAARVASRAALFSRTEERIDEALVIWFPAPRSFTGEDVVEFHVHGGLAVVSGVLEVLAAAEGLRAAEAGEFTRQAFENGKLDLTAAEGLADLVVADTDAQRRQALRQMRGELGEIYEGWRNRLLGVIGHLEATIDFSDEDLPDGVNGRVEAEVMALRREIENHLGDGGRGERIREGIRIAIIGPPNAGKSSILNSLTKSEAAIVSRHPGTTRDVIEVPLKISGFRAVIADTAGIREGVGEVEEEGVRRARREARGADLKIAVFDGVDWPRVDADTVELLDDNTIVVVNKTDLGGIGNSVNVDGVQGIGVSAITGEGMARLSDAMARAVADRFRETESPALTRLRHRVALEECHQALCRCEGDVEVELMAEELRMAGRCLGRITGRVDVEQVLDVIFRDFCIGK